MKLLSIILLYLLGVNLIYAQQTDERLEVLLMSGIDAFENNRCKDDGKEIGAVTYFEDYINLGGKKSDVLKYLAYCKINIGQSKAEEIDTLKDGVQLLSEVFESDNKNIEILKLLLYLYIELKDYDKAKTYAILTNEESKVDNDLHILIARLYFSTKEYNKVVNYALKYEINDQNKHIEAEKLFMIAYSYFKSNNYKQAKIYLNKIIKEKKDKKDLVKISLNILKKIDENENFGKYPNWYSLSITNGIIFDSNVTSQPPFTQDSITNIPGIPSIKSNDTNATAAGIRDENYISLFLYPLNLNEHSILVNINNFMAFHYPLVVEDLFDPQEYDAITLSTILGYEYHKYFTKNNILKFLLYGGYDLNWTNPVNNFNLYSTTIKSGFNIYYKFENNIDIGLYSTFNIDDYNIEFALEDKFSQEGKYFDSILSTSLPITSNFILSLGFGYIGSITTGDLFQYNGFLGSAGLSFKFFDSIKLSTVAIFEKKEYKNETRSDQLLMFSTSINFNLNNYFDINLFYSYGDNSSEIDDFSYKKHLVGAYFNFTM